MKVLSKHFFRFAFTLFILTAALALVFQIGATDSVDAENAKTSAKLVSEDETVLVPSDNQYTIIFSSDANQLDATLATELRTELRGSGQTVAARMDTVQSESKYEILIGNTNRQLSAELHEICVSSVANDSLVWGFAFRDGKFAFNAATDEAFSRGYKDFFDLFVRDSSFVVKNDLWLIVSLSRAEYEAELKEEQDRIEAEKEAARLQRIKELKEAIEGFSFSDFSDYVTLDFTVMPDTDWGSPQLYPTVGEHPRLNVNKHTLELVRAYIDSGAEEAVYFYESLIKKANEEFNGVLKAPYKHETGRVGFHNVDEKGLSIIEAKAFAYLLTGDEEYGYQAILAMKNYLKTLELGWIHSDQCREFGRTIYCAAEVYDWCHDLLSENDKNQFMIAITDICASDVPPEFSGLCQSGDAQMEIGYPPKLQSSVAGHGSEHQLLRDYLSVAIAIFDENPSWYEECASRIYNDFIAVRNHYFTSGTYPQGVNNYAPFRHNADVWSAWMLLQATGENPYTDDLQRITRSFLEYRTPGGSFFGTGDGGLPKKVSERMANSSILIAALYGDAGMRGVALEYFGGTFDTTKITGHSIEMSLAHHLILGATYYDKLGTTDADDVNNGVSPVIYHSYPVGQMIAREEWGTPDVPSIFMKVGIKHTANHEHGDGGTFQIYYKGLYSGESGVYDKYGSTHFNYYHQETVAHNGLLIFNPDLADAELNGTSVENATNLSRIFYTGSQVHKFSGFSDLDSWLANTSTNTGTVLGQEYKLTEEGKAEYVYLAGDISTAYLPTQAKFVGRNMLSIFTGDENYPMFFLVYDSITTTNENFVNKFLLHTPTEPVIDGENKTVTITDMEGRLVLHALKGADEITSLGGDGKNYLINGVQCALTTTGSDGMWGRVELSNTGSIASEFFNVMYVTDATNDEKLDIDMFESDLLIGTQLDDTVVVFTKSQDRSTDELIFEAEGTGLIKYYVCGLFEGTWNIEVDGINVAHRVSSEEGGMITFYAPAGEVRVKPGSNIAPSNGGRIIYNSYGGIVPDDAPLVYEIGQTIVLPANIVRGEDTFLGWYTSPYFEEETLVTEITPTEKGKFAVYAKYRSYPINEDFEDLSFAFGEVNKTFGKIQYGGNGKIGSWFEILTNAETGNKFLAISRTDRDMQLDAHEDVATFIGLGDTKITYEVELARNGDKAPLSSSFMLREETTSQRVTLFKTLEDGSVKFGGTTLFILNDEFQKVVVTVDFANAMLYAYNEFGDLLADVAFTVPKGSAHPTTLDYMLALTYTFNWWMGSNSPQPTGGESMLVDNIKVYCGEFMAPENILPEGTNRIIYKLGTSQFIDKYPKTYTVGETVTIPEPVVDNGTFLGWYTTQTFDEGTKIEALTAENADAPITLYAKCSITLVDEDFTDSEVDVLEKNVTVDDFLYQLNGKIGSYAKTETDESGNKYVKIYTDGADASINNYAPVSSAAISAGGKVTYEIDLALIEEGRFPTTSFKPRGDGGSSDTINIFTTNSAGNVLLNGKLGIGALTTDLQKFIFTFDIYAETITAYSVYGLEIASVKVSVPKVTADLYETVADWFAAVSFCLNWHFSAHGGLLFDNVKIYSGEYVPAEGVIPEGSNVIIYQTGPATLPDGTPDLYTVGTPYTLPTLSAPDAQFMGWYTSPTFEEGTEISVIDATNADAPIRVYAKFNTVIFNTDFSSSTLDKEAEAATDCGISYVINGKTGTRVKAVKDANGNTYIRVETNEKDATVNYMNSTLGQTVLSGGGKVTYEIDLATTDDGRISATSFRARGANTSSDGVYIFSITKAGTVILSNNSKCVVGSLTTKLTKFVFTLDVYKETLTAYSTESGEALYTVSVSVPAVSAESFETFADWFGATTYGFNFQISAGGGVAYDNVKIYTGEYVWVEPVLPEGTNKIIYNAGVGTLPTDAPELYKIGEQITLPSPSVPDGSVFVGWYTTPTFDKGTEISVINAENADEPIKLYAKYNTVIKNLDFTGSDMVVNEETKTVDGIIYQLMGKTGASAVAVTDENGNTYIRLRTEGTDASLSYKPQNAVAATIAGGGKVTYEIDLALLEEGKFSTTSFKVRGNGGSSDTINIFGTNSAGQVILNNVAGKSVGELTTSFKRFIFTFDIYAATITAYDVYGYEILSTEATVPQVTAGTYETVADWFAASTYFFYWHFGISSGILYDNVNVYVGEYIPKDASLPENMNKIFYDAGEGTLSGEYDQLYIVGVDANLPIPTLSGAEFIGWYTSANFEESTKVSVLNMPNSNEPVYLYAKYRIVIFEKDFTDSTAYLENTNQTCDGITYHLNGKTGTLIKAETDEQGNTYIAAYTGTNDTTISYTDSKLFSKVSAGGGKITYEISLAALNGRSSDTSFRTRSYKSDSTFKNVISLFQTKKSGEILLSGDANLVIGTLSESFTKIIFTLDITAATLTAYNEDGSVIASTNVAVPSVVAESYASFEEWYVGVSNVINWHVGTNVDSEGNGIGGIAFDDIKIYTGDYIPSV